MDLPTGVTAGLQFDCLVIVFIVEHRGFIEAHASEVAVAAVVRRRQLALDDSKQRSLLLFRETRDAVRAHNPVTQGHAFLRSSLTTLPVARSSKLSGNLNGSGLSSAIPQYPTK